MRYYFLPTEIWMFQNTFMHKRAIHHMKAVFPSLIIRVERHASAEIIVDRSVVVMIVPILKFLFIFVCLIYAADSIAAYSPAY